MRLVKFKILVFLFPVLTSWGQTGPAGVGMSDGSSALKLWLDANREVYRDSLQKNVANGNEKTMLWKDLSGYHNDVKAKNDTNSPTLVTASPLLNHQNAIRFFQDETITNRRTYMVSDTFAKTNDITIYCIFHALTKAFGNNVSPFQSKTYHPNMWYSGAGLVDGGVGGFVNDVSLAFCDTSIAAGVGDSTTGIDYCIKTSASIHKTYFTVLEKEAWTGKLSLTHNNSVPVTYQAGAQPINNAERYFIGSTSDVYTGKLNPFFDGYIASVLIYNKLLNAAEKTILENYLAAKYDLPLYNNDLYKFDDASQGNYDYELIGIGKASDGSFQLSAKGEGFVELGNAKELERGAFMFIAHDGKSLAPLVSDLPEGILHRLERKWVCGKTGNISQVDLTIDHKAFAIDPQSFALLIDTDNDGFFDDETMGKGMLVPSEITSQGRLVFRGVALNKGNHFTFAQIKPVCQSNCEAYFSPDGDGVADVYYLQDTGKTSIYDRSGKLVKSISAPAYWDGTNDQGQPSAPGIYFLIANDVQETVTLIK